MNTHTAIIKSASEPFWYSCKLIRNNILSSYKIYDPNIKIYSLTEASAQQITLQIIKKRIKRLIFIESNPLPYDFIKLIEGCLPSIEEYCFHLYGNFTCHIDSWNLLIKRLKSKRVKFIVASSAQQKLVRLFLNQKSSTSVEVCPFPVNTIPTFCKNNSTLLREKMGFSVKDYILIYSGRITPEKNVNLLLEFVKRFINRNPKLSEKIKVLIAGEFEDHGQFFLNRYSSLGEYHHRWNTWFNSLPANFRDRVQLLGFLNHKHLQQFYEISDLFVSLSTFHDEDYGMAPIEALSTGCPAILSHWGGYSDFAIDANMVRTVPVRITPQGLQLNYTCFEESLNFFMQKRDYQSTRQKISSKYLENFSIEAISKKYREIHQRPYSYLNGGSQLLSLYKKKFEKSLHAKSSLYESYTSNDAMYKKVYSTYI